MKKNWIVVLGLTVCVSAHAGDALTAEQVKAQVIGKTLTTQHEKLGAMKTYYAPDGTLKRAWNAGSNTGKWQLDDAGVLCFRMENQPKDFCGTYEKSGTELHIVRKDEGRITTTIVQQIADGDATK